MTGKVRALLERIYNWIKRNGEPPVGSRAWEAKLELEKLPNIIAERQARLAAGDLDPSVRAELEAEIGDLEAQIDYHARTLDEMDVNPGIGYVAADGLETEELANWQEIKKLLGPDDFKAIASVTGGSILIKTYNSVKQAVSGDRELSISLTANLLKEIKTRGASSPRQAEQIASELLDPQSNWVASQTTKVSSRQQGLEQAREIGLTELEDEVTELENIIGNKQSEIDSLSEEVKIPISQYEEYNLTSKDIGDKEKKIIDQLEDQIEDLDTQIKTLQAQIDPLQTEQSINRRIESDEKIKKQKEQREIQRQEAEKLRKENTFGNDVTAEQAWKRLIAKTDNDSSSALWAKVLKEQGIISNELDIIAYLETIELKKQLVQDVRIEFKKYYRTKLWELINSLPAKSPARYQKMKQIADGLDSQGKGDFSERWYQQRYGARRDISGKPIDNSTQVVLKTKEAQKYGVRLQNEKHRKFDEVYGDENSATIREHKHVSQPLGSEQIKQYQDNVQIVSYNQKSKNKNKPLVLEKDGNRYRPDELMYTFATPEGVKANAKFMKEELEIPQN